MRDLFSQIVNESLLNEIHRDREEDVKDAINNVLRVRMSYDDRKGGKGKNERFILPVAFGLTKNGKKAVRAYETMGSSKRGLTNPPNNRRFPKWKLFLLDNIYSWNNGKKSFRDYKDTLIRMGLNTHGDKSMTTLFAITPFADDDVQVAKDTDSVSKNPVSKTDVEPTTSSQNQTNANPDKFTSAKDSREKNIDNNQDNGYLKTKLDAPEAEPVTRKQVTTPQDNSVPDNETMKDLTARETEPVTKDDVEGGEKEDNIKDIRDKFNDFMNRMDNVNKDKEEDEQ